jgi:hypothetical protein
MVHPFLEHLKSEGPHYLTFKCDYDIKGVGVVTLGKMSVKRPNIIWIRYMTKRGKNKA